KGRLRVIGARPSPTYWRWFAGFLCHFSKTRWFPLLVTYLCESLQNLTGQMALLFPVVGCFFIVRYKNLRGEDFRCATIFRQSPAGWPTVGNSATLRRRLSHRVPKRQEISGTAQPASPATRRVSVTGRLKPPSLACCKPPNRSRKSMAAASFRRNWRARHQR